MNIKRFVLLLAVFAVFALAGCGGGSSTPTGPSAEELAAMQMREMEQKTALEEAHEALDTALAATLNTQGALDAANAAHKTLSDAIAAADDVSAADKAKYETAASDAMGQIAQAQKIFDEAETERMAMERERQRMEDAAAAAAMAATAAKLYAGIAAPTTTSTGEPGRRFANHAGTAGDRIFVGIDQTDVILLEDKKTTVAANHGWEGKRYAAEPDGDGMYEAMVWSNVGEPKMGARFNSGESGVGFDLDTDGVLVSTETIGDGAASGVFAADNASRIASPQFDHSAGTKVFKLPEDNPSGATRINIPGSYYGVSGTYTCTASGADTCTAVKASGEGYTLGVTGSALWTFKPTNAEARVTDTPDAIYASYGWWIHTAEDGKLTASAFHDIKGAPTPVVADTFSALQGTATYSGGAAGKYALSSTTGGTNDAGHFTARATLEADFGNATAGGTIAGTIDNFMGADGMARDWSVELKKGTMGTVADGAAPIDGPDDGTVWTIDETAASASGEWSGALRNQGMDGVPSVATGTFYTEYGTGGRMVGAFGANKEE